MNILQPLAFRTGIMRYILIILENTFIPRESHGAHRKDTFTALEYLNIFLGIHFYNQTDNIIFDIYIFIILESYHAYQKYIIES